MTDNEILSKAIEKALNNNWDVFVPLIPTYALELANPDKVIQAVRSKKSINDIIFNHSFAKAFWGEKNYINGIRTNTGSIAGEVKMWQYHLKELVLYDNPLEYIAKFI